MTAITNNNMFYVSLLKSSLISNGQKYADAPIPGSGLSDTNLCKSIDLLQVVESNMANAVV